MRSRVRPKELKRMWAMLRMRGKYIERHSIDVEAGKTRGDFSARRPPRMLDVTAGNDRGEMRNDSGVRSEKSDRRDQWDDDYYHPIALKLYDGAVADMLVRMMEVEKGATVLVTRGAGRGCISIRVAKAGATGFALIDISTTMLGEARRPRRARRRRRQDRSSSRS